MILQELYNYYQRKADDPESKIAPFGYEWKEIPFIIVIDKDGNFLNLEDTRSGEKNKVVQKFLVLKTKGRSGKNSWQIANIFWDHYGYVLAQPKLLNQKQNESDKKFEKAKKKTVLDAKNQNSSFLEVINQTCDAYPENVEFNAVKNFYLNPGNSIKLKEHTAFESCYKKPGSNMAFRLKGNEKIIAENKLLEKLFCEKIEQEDSSKESVCLITGKKAPIAILHTGSTIPGGKANAKLVGFQKGSGYDSYYKQQGMNAPVSISAESAYTTALNGLLAKDSKNKFQIGDTIYLFWSEKSCKLEKTFPSFFKIPKDDPDKNIEQVKEMLSSVYTGKHSEEDDIQFFLLGCAPNAARISIRLWQKGTVKSFSKKIAQHFTDLEIIKGKFDSDYYPLFTMLSHISFEYKVEKLPPNLISSIVYSVITGGLYPSTMQQQCLRRIRAEQKIDRMRAAMLKAYLNRKQRIYAEKNYKEIKVALDETNCNPGYVCGRLFAVLEKIQNDALGNVNAGIRERYYGAASATPVTVFGRLLDLTNHHLSKLEKAQPGWKVNDDKILQSIMILIDAEKGFPSHLSLDDQSRFAIGYYHQKEDFYKGKEKTLTEDNNDKHTELKGEK